MVMNSTDVLAEVEQRSVVAKKWRIPWVWQGRSITFLMVVSAVYFVGYHVQTTALYNQHLGHGALLVNQALHAQTVNRWLAFQRFREAEKTLREALVVKPNDGKALYYSGIVHLSMRRGNDAIKAFNLAERSYRRHELYYGRGQARMYLMNDREKARSDYMRVLSLNPDFELARRELKKMELNHAFTSRNIKDRYHRIERTSRSSVR
jgi:tetratricopeptide (TPR) repeat protein